MVGWRERMHVQRSESLAEFDVLLEAHALVAEEDDLVGGERTSNGVDLRLREACRQVDAEDLGTKHWRQRPNVELDGLFHVCLHGRGCVVALRRLPEIND
jgi:hypothetical protein